MNTENSKESILQKALTLFSAHGYDGTGIQDITVAAGVTKPTLYYFFGNKDGLFEAIWKSYFPLLEVPLEQYSTYENHIHDYKNDVYGQLVRIVTVFFSFAKTQPEFFRLMMETVYAPPESKASVLSVAYFNKLYTSIEHFFSGAAQAHGNLNGREHTFAVSLLAQINAYVGIWLSQQDKAPLDETCIHTLVKQFMHGIFA